MESQPGVKKDADRSKMTLKMSEKDVLFWSSRSGNGVWNMVMCGLCVLSFTASAYFSYRESVLESRLGALEAQFATMGAANGDVIMERLRREMETRFQQRMTREVASGRRLLMDAAASNLQQQVPLSLLPLQNHARTPRDISECICPPGREPGRHFFALSHVHLLNGLTTSEDCPFCYFVGTNLHVFYISGLHFKRDV